MGIELNLPHEIDFKKEQERQTVLSKLRELYHKRSEILRTTRSHDTSITKDLDLEILKLENKLRFGYEEPYTLTEVKWGDSDTGKKAKEKMAIAAKLIAQIQALSMSGDQESAKYQKICRELEELGVRFACIVSDPAQAGVVVGDAGMVHRDVRQLLSDLREKGEDLPSRADSSGFLVHTSGNKFAVVVDSPNMIWTTHLETRSDQGLRRAYLPVIDTDLDRIGEAELVSPNLLPLIATSTESMEEFLTSTHKRVR